MEQNFKSRKLAVIGNYNHSSFRTTGIFHEGIPQVGKLLGPKFMKFAQIRQKIIFKDSPVLDDTPTIELATLLGHKEVVLMAHSFIGAGYYLYQDSRNTTNKALTDRAEFHRVKIFQTKQNPQK